MGNKLSIGPKIGLIIIGIILITIFVDYFIKMAVQFRLKHEPKPNLQEGFLGDEFMWILSMVSQELIMGIVLFIIATAGIIIGEFMPNLVTGINNHFKCGMTQSDDGYKTGLQVLTVLLECSWDKFVKFFNGQCSKYYVVDILYGICYGLFVELPIFLVYILTFGQVDLSSWPAKLSAAIIGPLDEWCYGWTGYHIDRWSDDVVNNCYRCQGTVTVNGQNSQMTETFGWWASIFKCTNKEIADGTDKIFKSIIPDEYWSTWFNGNHLQGDDWNL